MKTILKNGLRAGITFGIVFIFLLLIGFITVGATMIGDILGNTGQEEVPVSNLLLTLAVLGLFTGISARSGCGECKWWTALMGGLTAGLISGILAWLAIWITGTLSVGGTELQTYLPNLDPEDLAFLRFYSTPAAAANTYLMYLTLFSLVGAGLAWLLSFKNWFSRGWDNAKTKVSSWFEAKNVNEVIHNPWATAILFVVVGVALYFLPLAWGSYWNYIMGTVAIYILLGLGLNIIVGYSGQLVLGYVAFFATGAYTFALLTAPTPHGIGLNLWLAVGASVLVSTLTGLLLGLPILNLRGDYLAIVTLGFGEIIRILIKSDLLTNLTNGPKGVTNVGQPNWGGEVFSDVNYMHLLMLLVLIGLFVAKRLKDSGTGRAWIAIREDQTVAQATGINTYGSKILALLLGAAFAGLAGALFASRNQFTGPEDFTLMVSVNVLCIVIVGGMGSLPGIVLGSFVLKGLPELLRELEDYRLLAFGALLVVMMIVRPEGLWPAASKHFKRPSKKQPTETAMEVKQ
ncbi:leucine/isoleucine/valine transporter permease subunit [bacterium]|nr:leucine/isoleucine/valine transporter permease subunit [bacterium]